MKKTTLEKLKRKMVRLRREKRKIEGKGKKKTSTRDKQKELLNKLGKTLQEAKKALSEKNYTLARSHYRKARLLFNKLLKKPKKNELDGLREQLSEQHRRSAQLTHLGQLLKQGKKSVQKKDLSTSRTTYKKIHSLYYKIGKPAERYHEHILEFYQKIMALEYKTKK